MKHKTESFDVPGETRIDKRKQAQSSVEARTATRKSPVRERELQQTVLLSPLGMPPPRHHSIRQLTKHQRDMHVLDQKCNVAKKDGRRIRKAVSSLLSAEQLQERDEEEVLDTYSPKDATDSYTVQKANARRNMRDETYVVRTTPTTPCSRQTEKPKLAVKTSGQVI